MSGNAADNSRSAKRLKTFHEDSLEDDIHQPASRTKSLVSLSRSITPPPSRRPQAEEEHSFRSQKKPNSSLSSSIPSPIQLTHIRDISASSGNNVDAIKLRDILGDPLIKECWQFNYLFDVDFLMSQFDEDVRGLVKVKVVHGSWKREAPNRIRIDEACRRYPNVEAVVAYMPEPFGTHHSKIMILIRHDGQAQVVIHTSNMIPGDWANMSQAVWRSPLLPELSSPQIESESRTVGDAGSGSRFKRDLLSYLKAYGATKTGSLVKELRRYDFSSIRAALIASVPSRQEVGELDSEKQSLWGWPALKDTLRHVPVSRAPDITKQKPHIVVQISSVATLGQTDKWLKDTFFNSLSAHHNDPKRGSPPPNPKFSIIFPTPDEIRRSLNGYGSGGSIHMKLQSAQQQKQLQYMKPYLCRWAGDNAHSPTENSTTPKPRSSQRTLAQSTSGEKDDQKPIREAGRRRAAPHIKTYIRFSDSDMTTIDWAMVTSANLSTQAWGAAANGKNEIRICSWEVGVLIWPDLFADKDAVSTSTKAATVPEAKMVPCFKRDVVDVDITGAGSSEDSPCTIVGLRMPYDLPLTPYTAQDMPWCATATYTEPDWLGQTWDEA
ncbi:hypothetical protein AJ80_01218 [Polytolypa hystricis UAMH7299]|uniref:Tyrosyl-DNA phosphodiesterase n=1 Tax=Polytolypa hystricis (strain UAMH7299) TaxID=1447883 RepID=A0A2B7Z1B5_POLH7|nr:hypothetical protein AJ80_01218 [Polytolypa hystricis UAMH7299]